MATGTGTGQQGGESRASESVATQPVFRTRTMAQVETTSSAVAQRWAPEGPQATRAGAMRTLSFADRMITSYLGGSDRAETDEPESAGLAKRTSRRGPARRSMRRTQQAQSVGWLFPYPWYEDELDWMSAARAATIEDRRASVREDRVDGPQVSAPPLPMELVAPGLAAPSRPGRPSRTSPSATLRAFHPAVDARAARAAELVAELTARHQAPVRSADPTLAGQLDTPAPAPILTYVAPSELASGDPQPSHRVQSAARQTLERTPPSRASAAAIVPAQSAAEPPTVGATAPAAATPSPSDDSAAPATGEPQAPVVRTGRPVDRAVDLLAHSALSGLQERLAPSAGPRVIMPAGLGAVMAQRRAADSAFRPAERAPAPSMHNSAAPAALDHLRWSDRWLARFGGASVRSVAGFDTQAVQLVRAGRARPFEPTFAAPARPRPAPAAVYTAADNLVVDESEPVSDDVLSAIAEAAANDRAQRRAAGRKPAPAQPAGPAAAPRRTRPSAADRALSGVSVPVHPGLGAQLGASPVAPALSGLVEFAQQPTFDVRAFAPTLWPSAPADRSDARAERPSLWTGRAPGAVWLGLEPAERRAAPPVPLRMAAPAMTSLASAQVAGDAVNDERAALAVEAVAGDASRDDARVSGPTAQAAADSRLAGSYAVLAGGLAGPSAALAMGARPGAMGLSAESFAGQRALGVSDLALDFVSPEMIVAARSYGFGPIEAARAQRLAQAGRPTMTNLASMVDRVFVASLSPGQGSPSERGRAAEQPAARALGSAAPLRSPRGAFLLPEFAVRSLDIRPGQASEQMPDIGTALELVAAGQVAEAASQARFTAPSPADDAGDSQPAIDDASPAAGHDQARAQLPAALRPVFDAVYLSLSEHPDTRPLAPAARAARALALAHRFSHSGEGSSARARAAAAWAVLPVVLSGEAAAEPEAGWARSPAMSSRPGDALGELVAPSYYADRPPRAPEQVLPVVTRPEPPPMPAATPPTPVVQTGSHVDAAAIEAAFKRVNEELDRTRGQLKAAQRPPPAPPTQPPSMPSDRRRERDDKKLIEMAQKYFESDRSSSQGLTVAEMTLVTAAPKSQIAASSVSADRPVVQAMQTPQATGGQSAGAGGAGQQQPDVEKIAQEVYEQICRMLEIARERSGDPWQR